MTVVVDEQDDMFYTRAALEAHSPGEGRITVHPTPASSSPAALAHDLLYALGKRLASGPGSPDVWLDSVEAAWLAAAAWAQATGVRHVVVPRAHLLTLQRIDRLLAWRAATGVQLTLLWQRTAKKLPPVLSQVERRLSGQGQFMALLAEPGPMPARPSFPPVPLMPPKPDPEAVAFAGQSSVRLPQEARSTSTAADRPARPCAGAMATAHLSHAASAARVAPENAAILSALAHPLIAGALSVLAFTRVSLGSLRSTRDLDITGDVSAIKIHGAAHRSCTVYAVPYWARPMLTAARAYHRLKPRPPEDGVFDPVLLCEARHLRAHTGHLPHFDLTRPAGTFFP
ncbi:hypothetical protein [Streptomyces sp. NBC_01367]|uniref:hypothetical protein n=1 Tax=Streptomyces sp. NBC_01367 TaxID=2903841 RepID=UPI003253E81C